MRILAIETSCDETGVALLDITGPVNRPEVRVLANSLFSQAHLHAEYGGVYPNLAKREHHKNLPLLLEKTLSEASNNGRNSELVASIDHIAVTAGPGLEPALWAGITFAQELGRQWGKPVVPTNHMEGHIASALFDIEKSVSTPALALLVSGGHTELVLVPKMGEYQIIGRTRDDAVGEAFDKVARMLGLGYPGGPKISKLASERRGELSDIDREFPDADREQAMSLNFPRPMINSGDLDFSYSGLKTAVLYAVKNLNIESEEVKQEVALAFEDAAIDVLISKTRQALEKHGEIETLIVGGGVAANKYLRERLLSLKDTIPTLDILLPSPELSTDNAVMIGMASYIAVETHPEVLKTDVDAIRANGNLFLGA